MLLWSRVAVGEGTELNGPTVLPPLILTREGQSVGVAGCCSSIVELKRAFIKTDSDLRKQTYLIECQSILTELVLICSHIYR